MTHNKIVSVWGLVTTTKEKQYIYLIYVFDCIVAFPIYIEKVGRIKTPMIITHEDSFGVLVCTEYYWLVA